MDVDGDVTDDIVCGSPNHLLAPPNGKKQLVWPQYGGVYRFTGGAQHIMFGKGPAVGYTQTSGYIFGDFNGDGGRQIRSQADVVRIPLECGE